MTRIDVPLPQQLPQQRSFGQTSRRDVWWLQPLAVFLGLLAFVGYSTWAALQGENYFHIGAAAAGGWESQYLSPFYSPVLFTDPAVPGAAPFDHAWLGAWPDWLRNIWPAFLPLSPALLILLAPGLFRFTCYYYRGAYYKSFWADPASCAVGEPRKSYWGERKFPLILQNIHRYFLYLALIFIVILGYDAVISYIFVRHDAAHEVVDRSFGIGVGSIVLTLNVILLGGYTFGCHSLRHIAGGRKDCISSGPAQYQAYKCVSCLNRRHMLWAWMSLFWVGFSDFYVRMCAMGVWSDPRWIAG